ncbi:MAG TPA: dihydrolipoyl dehydrogenase [Tepidisphaeraceae bacterium]|nr:dihydrolipoyl dehydrogenase [Tepidisphaeraceae bacterium]
MSENNYDLVVIGAGPGGYVAAIRAAQLGMSVAIVEKEPALGGTCSNWGCIPTKALLDSSEFYHQAKHDFAKHGLKVGSIDIDLPALLKRKDGVVSANANGIAYLMKKNKIAHVKGTARIASANSVVVTASDGDKTLSTKRVLIATGSAPIELPAFKYDGKHVVSSDHAINLPKIPEKLLIIGAGVIGLELGSVWARLGSQVQVVEFLDRIAPNMDKEMTTALQKLLEKQGFKFKFKTGAQTATIANGKVKVDWASGDEKGVEEADVVLVAVGRKPYTQGLGLTELGVEIDKRGFVQVDAHYQTKVPGVYAIGDVIGGMMLAHKAEEEGYAAVELMAGKAGHVNYNAVPNVIYTNPELASVGYGEDDAKAKGFDIKVGKFPFMANGRARAMGQTDGFVKVIGDAKTDRLLGVHILAPRASDMIAEAAVAIEFASSVEDIARSVHAHPTLAEAFKEAAMNVEKQAIHI